MKERRHGHAHDVVVDGHDQVAGHARLLHGPQRLLEGAVDVVDVLRARESDAGHHAEEQAVDRLAHPGREEGEQDEGDGLGQLLAHAHAEDVAAEAQGEEVARDQPARDVDGREEPELQDGQADEAGEQHGPEGEPEAQVAVGEQPIEEERPEGHRPQGQPVEDRVIPLQDLDGEGHDGHEGQEAEDGAADDLAPRDLVEEDGLAQGDPEGLFDVVEASRGGGRGRRAVRRRHRTAPPPRAAARRTCTTPARIIRAAPRYDPRGWPTSRPSPIAIPAATTPSSTPAPSSRPSAPRRASPTSGPSGSPTCPTATAWSSRA